MAHRLSPVSSSSEEADKRTLFVEPDLPTLAHSASNEKNAKAGLGDGLASVPTRLSYKVEREGEVGDVVEDGAEGVLPVQKVIPWRYKLLALSMIIFFSTGSSFSEATLAPLKSTLVKKLGINNAKYGAISSATSLVNTILPIVGGIGIDHWGATYAAILSSVFVLVGAIISASGANTTQYGLVIGGRILMGFGSTVIESTQNKLYSHWFTGSNLAFIYGFDIAYGRIVTLVSKATAVPMSEINGWWGWALWIPTILCAVNLALCIGYWAFERRCPVEYRPRLGKDARDVEGVAKRISWNTLKRIPRFYWVLCGSQLFQSSAVTVYTSNLADIQTATRGTSTLAAGYNTSLQSIIPIVLTPFTGFLFDRFGWRMLCVSGTAILWIVAFALIGLTTVHPLCPIMIGSFASAFNAIPFIASIPLILGNNELLGTGFGIWKAFNNAGAVTLDVASGAIQDESGTGTNQYNNVIYFIIAIKIVQVFLGAFYDFLDGRWIGHALRKPESKRVEMMNELARDGVILKGWQINRKYTYAVAAELASLVVVAWVVYILYSLGT